ncbi:MAG: HAMP domain-containing histidine kinase [Desulfovibrionales bacterium]|nr:HAMP domain-containing histidine kinase [Desulfovibrionales bacterium]
MLKSINAKLTASFFFILALSLAVYLTLFSKSIQCQTDDLLQRSLPIISNFLSSEFACISHSTPQDTTLRREVVRKRLPALAEKLRAEAVWVITPEGTKILPENASSQHDLFLEKLKTFDRGIFSTRISTLTSTKQALVFPVELWGKPAHVVMIQSALWPPHKILLEFLLPIAGTGLLIGLIILPFIHRTLRPLRELEEQVINFATGDLSQRISYTEDNEVGNLAKTFNILADNLEHMTRLRSELTANISHELRSPLTRIQIAEELATMSCDQGDYAKVRSHLQSIQCEIEEVNEMIEEILRISRIEMNAQIGSVGACDITETIKKIVDKNESIAAKKRLTVRTNYAYDCVITCDYPMVNLAISNLLGNAFKFSPEKSTVVINTMSDSQSVSVTVYNSFYRQLTEKELTKIFEPFTRAEGENIPGTGLGLALVAKVAEEHNGSVVAENRPHGILFRLTLSRSIPEHTAA